MFKKLIAFFAAMFLVTAFAAVDVNQATEAELDGIKGIGPVTSKLIMSERKKGEFKNWNDFVARVKGVGDKSAAQFSAEGLTVSDAKYEGPAAAPAKKASKPMMEKAKDAAVTTKDAVKGAAIRTKDAVKETAKDVKAAVTPKADAAKPAASAAKK
ncbi:MAG: helix-hairpin-helix domain-containing protein [Rhodoferax sp.]|uniref:ComEA family DNA-binding protein n=1 Tax=Rhodoferax sp. TaxID=50421 RepID=UPI001400E645|nr:helix-hairpin-helix domain-containing protein [Rhodoferax sp.]NDP37230.1 helix-hairpin-helix domain-containing protein [Rhodoferax sp.]